MCIALVGGMDRLDQHYLKEAQQHGVELRIFTRSEAGLARKIRKVDAVIVFTNKVSHKARREVMQAVGQSSIPVMFQHSCGLCTFRDCIRCLKNEKKEA